MKSLQKAESESKGFETTKSRVRFTSSAPNRSADHRSPHKVEFEMGPLKGHKVSAKWLIKNVDF